MRAFQKKNGIYYTPKFLAQLIVNHVISKVDKVGTLLEPSVGGGVFLDVITTHSPETRITALDVDLTAVSRLKAKKYERVICNDFLKENFAQDRFDLVVGNPPYISWRNIGESTRALARNILLGSNLKMTTLNMWGIFLLRAELLVEQSGALAFVLPSDIKETIGGNRLLNYMLTKFDRIELIDIPKDSFLEVDQDTIIFFGYRKHDVAGLFTGLICSTSKQIVINDKIDKNFSQLGKASLPFSDLEFSEIFSLYEKMPKIGDFCTTSPGIVTAANRFFIVSEEMAKKLGVRKKENRIVPKGYVVNGHLDLTKSFFTEMADQGTPCYLLNLESEKKFSGEIEEYLKVGVKLDLPLRYKMKRRDPWYKLPSVWTSECVFFKRTHLFPKLLLNDEKLLVTDAAYRINFLNDTCKESFLYSFYNSFTLLFAEILGRKYAGGVLELTPSEFRKLPLPYTKCCKNEFEIFRTNFNTKNSIREIFSLYDQKTLYSHAPEELSEKINSCYSKLIAKRLQLSL